MVNHITRHRFWSLALLSLALLALVREPVLSQDDLVPIAIPCQSATGELVPRGHFFGWTASVAVDPTDPNRIYLGEGSGLTVFDATNPVSPTYEGGVSVGTGDVTAIVPVSTTAYAVNGDGLRVIDVSDPEAPALSGSLDLTGTTGALAVTGGYAYVARTVDWTDGWLHAVDISDPENPSLLASFDTPGGASDVSVVGDPSAGLGEAVVYVADGDALLMLDASDPLTLTELASYEPPEPVHAATVISTTAYLLTKGTFPFFGAHLRIVDVSDPASPDLLGSYDALDDAEDVHVVGSTAYVADGDGGLQILDVSDPENPDHLGTYDAGWSISGVATSGSRAYVIGGERGFAIVDVSDPENPDDLGEHGRPSAVMDVIVDGTIGYIAGYDKLWTVDLTNPVLPVPIGSSGMQDLVGEDKRLALAPHPQTGDPLVYVAEQYFGLEIFDVTAPASPTAIADHPTPGVETNDVAALGDYAYLLTDDGGDGALQVLDVSDPTDPQETDTYDTPGDARQIVVAETVTGTGVAANSAVTQTIAYVADGPAGLRIIDVSDPNDVDELNHVDPPAGGATDLVMVIDGWAWVGSNVASAWHVQVFDVTDPLTPTLLGEQQDQGQLNDLDVDEDYFYVALSRAGTTASLRSLWDPLWPADDDIEVEYGVRVYTGGRYFSTTDYESDYWGGYQTEDADSVHRYTASIFGVQHRFTFIDKITFGAEVAEVQDPPPGDCAINARIEPAKAETDGCTLSPLGLQPCDCGSDDEIVFEHQAANGWEWDGLTPDPVTCPESGTRTVIGQFAPFVTLSGGAAGSFLCMAEEPPPLEERTRTAFWFSLQASQADTWELTSLTFQASGDGDDGANIEEVRLYHGSSQIGTGTFGGDDGTVTFEIPTIIVTTSPQTFRLDYVFDFTGFDPCGAEAKQFDVSVTNLSSGLEPQNYKPGHISGAASGSVAVGCVVHEETKEAFDTIQEAVDGASEGTTISLCPGTYEENVDVEEAVTIQSLEGRDKTVVQAASSSDHVFHVQRDNVTIKGLTIEGATGTDVAGVYVQGSTIQGSVIQDNFLTDNRYGVYVQGGDQTRIEDNYVSSNTGSGVFLKSSTQSEIKVNSMRSNEEDGLYLEGCQDAPGSETTIEQNSVTRNSRHGIHLKQCAGIEIENNVSLSENEHHGVFVEDSQDVTIADNPIIIENSQDGISLDNATGVRIEGNPRIEENQEKGISLYNCLAGGGTDPNEILGNTISGNRPQSKQAVGIYLDNSTGTVIGSSEKPNTFRWHTSYGISMVNGSDDNTVRNNTVESNDQAGVHIHASCGNAIQENSCGSENGNGIKLDACQCAADNVNELTANTVEGNTGHGIHLKASYGSLVGGADQGNTVKSNDGSGVALEDCQAPAGQENRIEANTIESNAEHGVRLEESSGCVVSNGNDISENDEDGVYLLASDGNVVTGNTIDGGGRQKNGITVGVTGGYADPNEITDNTLHGHRENGIRLSRACNTCVGFTVDSPVTVKKNTIGPDNDDAGVRVEFSECSAGNENRIAGNEIHHNPYGVVIANSAGTDVGAILGVMNEIEQNEKDGILIETSSRIEIGGNYVKSNQENGIRVSSCQPEAGQENGILNNIIRENQGHGIHLQNTKGTQIGEPGADVNTISYNTGNGIHVDQCTSATDPGTPLNTIINNSIKDDNNHGVFLLGSRFTLVQDNEIRANYKNGIHLRASMFNQIHGNEDVAENGWHGVYMSHNSQQNDIAGNRIVDNKMAGIFLKESHYNFIPVGGGEPNTIEENDEDGIRIDAGIHNTIRENTIRENGRDGLRLSDAHYNEVLGEITIERNEGHGIYLERSQVNRFEGPLWVEVGVAAPILADYQAVIRDNDDYGIVFRDRSHLNRLRRYAVVDHGVCMRIDNSSSIHFEDDIFFACNLGVRETDSRDNAYTLQRFEACHVPYRGLAGGAVDPDGTAVLLENSSPVLEGCSLFDNEGDGIRTQSGSDPSVRSSNIYGNAGAGLRNLDPSVTVEARENWWGAANGPSGGGSGNGDEALGAVDVADWRPVTVTLVAVPRDNPVTASRGVTTTAEVRLRHWEAPTDTVTVTLADTLGWLLDQGPFTTTLNADTTVPVTFTIPSTVSIGTTDHVTFAARSQSDPTAEGITSFQVSTALVADLAIANQMPETAAGDTITATLLVTNTGPDGASSATVTHTLPSTTTVLSVTASQGTCTEHPGQVVCGLGSVASGGTEHVHLFLQPNADGLYTTAEVAAAEHDPDRSNNLAAAYAIVDSTSPSIYLPLVLRQTPS